MEEQVKGKKSGRGKVVLVLLIVLLAVGGFIAYPYYQLYTAGNHHNVLSESEELKIYIEKEVPFSQLGAYMEEKGWIKDGDKFLIVAEHKKRLNEIMLPGFQVLQTSWDNKTLVNQLYLSKDKGEVQLTFNNIRLKEELAERLGASVAPSKEDFLQFLNNEEWCTQKGFNLETIMTMFLPDTYQVYYKSTAEEILNRLAEEYKKFWTEENKAKATAIGLSQSEVSILASIVQAEQSRKLDEQSTIAGLYLNRLERGMRLESDPTLVFAHKDFSITWVKNKHKEIDSPYNTYKNAGLPPGPINMPTKQAINSVLNAEDHDYIFMCAKPETGGYHNFAKTYNQHLIYAKEYQKWNRERHRNG